MTERERWVVYPLLFLALGAALRDKLVDRTTTKSIVCQELLVEDEPVGNQPPRVLAKLGRVEATPTAPASGYLAVIGAVDVKGVVNVDGVVNAKQYVSQGRILTPAQQSSVGIPTLAELLRALQAEQNKRQPQPAAGQPKTSPPATPSDSTPKTAPANSPSDDGAQQKK